MLLPVAAPDAAAQLVELGEAEALGALDDHQRRVGHVDADLDHRRRDQHARARREAKRAITASLSGPFIRPWTSPTLSSPKRSLSTRARSSAAAASLFSLSSTSGQTQ